MDNNTIPTVMSIAGHDPTGGAGIQADIEAMVSMGCHPVTAITALTVQDTSDVKKVMATDSNLLSQQIRTVLEDMTVAAIKIGLLGSVENIQAISAILNDYPHIPVILDPVLMSGSGNPLSNKKLRSAMIDLLFPVTTILTPNILEARQLAPEADNTEACAQELMDMGCEFVLITGTHDNTPHVINHLYSNKRHLDSFTWERLPDSYHGSGCTLAASIAGLLAHGLEPFTAIHEAQEYTWETLKHGYRAGMGQLLPNRMFWAEQTPSNAPEDLTEESID